MPQRGTGIEVAFTVFWAGRVEKASRQSPVLRSEKVGPVFPPNVSRRFPGTHQSAPSQPATRGGSLAPSRAPGLVRGMTDRRWGTPAARVGGPVEGGLRASKHQSPRGPRAGLLGMSSGEGPLPGMSQLTVLLGPQVGPALGSLSGDALGRGWSPTGVKDVQPRRRRGHQRVWWW